MVKRMLWKDIRQTLSKSKGRVVSIVCLMALGSFALVGLKVTGPDMQATAADFYGRNNLADITVVSNYGISKDDERIIGKADGIKEVEYGYFKDVVISGTDRSMRIYSKPDAVSTYDVTEGRLPKRTGEIALDMKERDRFAVGSTLNVTEKTDIAGGTVLRHHKFTVVGFVRASETLSCLNMGQSTAGGGELKGYAVAVPGEFDSDVKMIARATYEDTEGLDYWSAEYRDAVQKHKDQLVTLLANQPKAREATIRSQQRKKIDEAKDKVKTSKQQLADAQRQLDDAKQQIDNAKDQLSEGSAEAVEEGSAAAAQLATAQAQLASANASVVSGQTQLQAAQTQLAQGQNQLSDSWNQLANGKTQLDAAREQLETSKTVLDKVGATLGKWEQTGITGKLYEQIRGKYDMAINQYNEACAEYNRQLNAYNAGLQQYQNAVARLDQGSQAYRSNADNLAQASKQIAEKQNELGKAVSQAGKQVADGVTQLIQGQRDIDKAETEYQSKLAEFNAQKPEAERKISEAERQITLAEEKIDNLTVPAYSVSGRREGLTSQGYRVYMVIEGIVAKLADIFPIFLYFVAGARHLQHHGTHGGRGTHQFRNVEGARLRQRGCDAQIHRIRIRRIHPGHMHRRARRPHAAAAYRRPRIQRGIHHAGHHAQIPPLDHHGRIRTCMDKRRRAGMAGRVQGTARKTGEPTAAQAAGQRLENSFGTFPTTMEPSEFHTQSDRP